MEPMGTAGVQRQVAGIVSGKTVDDRSWDQFVTGGIQNSSVRTKGADGMNPGPAEIVPRKRLAKIGKDRFFKTQLFLCYTGPVPASQKEWRPPQSGWLLPCSHFDHGYTGIPYPMLHRTAPQGCCR